MLNLVHGKMLQSVPSFDCTDLASSQNTIQAACHQLIEAISELKDSKARLESELSDDIVSDFSENTNPLIKSMFDATWSAQALCNEIAIMIANSHPASKTDSDARLNALSAYLLLSDVDEHIQDACVIALQDEKLDPPSRLVRPYSRWIVGILNVFSPTVIQHSDHKQL